MKSNGVYSCGSDWNRNGTNGEAEDVILCIQNALADLTTSESGTDNTVTVRLPDGRPGRMWNGSIGRTGPRAVG